MRTTTVSRRTLLKMASAAAVSSPSDPSLVFPKQTPLQESRAIFDEGLNWTSKSAAELLCDRIRRAGVNVFIPCVWHGRGTAWPSSLVLWDHKLAYIPGFDPLETLIQTAQRYEIEVHPWFSVARRDRDFLPQYYGAGTPWESFDVHRESFREFISSLVLEIVQRYPVAGVKLLAWQEHTVTDIVRRISTGARKINQDIVISVEAIPSNKLDDSQGRNSVMWADTGMIDVIYMMHYESSPDWRSLKTLQTKMKRPEVMVVLCGDYEQVGSLNPVTVSRESSLVSTLIEQGRTFQQGNGIGLYLYSMLSDEQIAHLRKTVFAVDAKPRWRRIGETMPHSPQSLQVQ